MSFELLIVALALSLILLGALGLWFWSKRRASLEALVTFEREPELEEPPAEEDGSRQRSAEPLPEAVQVVVAVEEGRIEGAQLLELFHTLGLRRGADDLFYWREGDMWFGVASADAHGLFPKELTRFQTRGLVFFLRPKELKKPGGTFEIMLRKAAHARGALGGIWLDETLRPLTEEKLEEMRGKLGGSHGRS